MAEDMKKKKQAQKARLRQGRQTTPTTKDANKPSGRKGTEGVGKAKSAKRGTGTGTASDKKSGRGTRVSPKTLGNKTKREMKERTRSDEKARKGRAAATDKKKAARKSANKKIGRGGLVGAAVGAAAAGHKKLREKQAERVKSGEAKLNKDRRRPKKRSSK